MPRPSYALGHTEGWDADFYRVALGPGSQFFQRVAHRGSQYRASCFSLSLPGSGPCAKGRTSRRFIDAPLDCHGWKLLSLDDAQTSYLRPLGILCGSAGNSNPAPRGQGWQLPDPMLQSMLASLKCAVRRAAGLARRHGKTCCGRMRHRHCGHPGSPVNSAG